MSGIKKAFELGLGIASLGVDTAKKSIDHLEKKGQINQKEAKNMLNSFVKASEKQRKEFVKIVETESKKIHQKAIDKTGFVSKTEHDKLAKRLEQLEKKHAKDAKKKTVKKKTTKKKK